MKLPLQIAFRNMDPSDAVEAKIRARAGSLERFAAGITSCRVAVEKQDRHRHQGNLFRVRVDLTVPGRELVAGGKRDADPAHADVYVAIRDAFDAARRQLEDYARRRRGDVKVPARPARRVTRARAAIQRPS